MSNCIHCLLAIDSDRLEFLQEFNKPLTCKNCSMEQPTIGYKNKPKIIKSKTNAQLKKINENYEQARESRKSFAKTELKEYKKFWKKRQKNKYQKRKA